MKHSNTLIPSIGTDFLEVLDYVITKCDPICLYTYETCRANYNDHGLYVEDRSGTFSNKMRNIVSGLYGLHRYDNKITIKFRLDMWTDDGEYYEVPIYITYWDGTIQISSTVAFFKEVTGYNSYRVIHFIYDTDGGVKWYRDHQGNLYEDFEQSIGE